MVSVPIVGVDAVVEEDAVVLVGVVDLGAGFVFEKECLTPIVRATANIFF